METSWGIPPGRRANIDPVRSRRCEVKAHNLTRRQLLGGGTILGASGLTLAGLGGYAWPHPAQAATTNQAAPARDARGGPPSERRPPLPPPALPTPPRGPAPSPAAPPYFILTPSGYPL